MPEHQGHPKCIHKVIMAVASLSSGHSPFSAVRNEVISLLNLGNLVSWL